MGNSAKNINIRVCILNWNGGETLHRCIDSLLQNTVQDFSITIIDNGSIDGSLDNDYHYQIKNKKKLDLYSIKVVY